MEPLSHVHVTRGTDLEAWVLLIGTARSYVVVDPSNELCFLSLWPVAGYEL